MATTILRARVVDVRYPTSDNLKGSDPFHRRPDYSAPYLLLFTSDPSLTGTGLVFTIGAGTDWVVRGIEDLAQLIVGLTVEEFVADPGKVHRRLIDHHQLRWLGDAGVFAMAVGGIMNALWDLAAKSRGLPMWRYLAGLTPQQVVSAINWRHLRDALTPDEAIQLLAIGQQGITARLDEFAKRGPEAYSTAGWSGLSDDQLREACRIAVFDKKMRSVKAKVGTDLADDQRRLRIMREVVGDEVALRVDANQIWGVDEAIQWMKELAEFRPQWIEEPTHPDDIYGYQTIRKALRPFGIGVACGEHTKNPVMFKQFLATGAIDYCQIDAARVAGPSEVFAAVLLAKKFGVPVCPHGGGIGLCSYILHYGAWDQIAVAASRDNRVVEWIDFLEEAMVNPVRISDGYYCLPSQAGWGTELKPDFVAQYTYPDGPFWSARPDHLKGPRFEA